MAEVFDKLGVVVNNERFKLVKKEGKTGEKIAKHNHAGANILFTVVKGRVEALINEEQKYELFAGKVLSFDGDNYLSATFLEDSEVFVTIVNK